MGCVYTGMKASRSVNGFFKVGMTEDKLPTRRWNAYNLQGLWYVYCPNATKTELLYLESVARLTAERLGLALQGNDCFYYRIEKGNKMEQVMSISQEVIHKVCQECRRFNIEYECKC